MSSATIESADLVDRPSPLLAAVCAAIAGEFNREWLESPVAHICEDAHVSRFRVSRLKATLLPRFTQCLSQATRRGRPAQTVSDTDARLAATQALLEVSSDLLRTMGIRGRPMQDVLVQTQRRLQGEHGISLRAFCEAVGAPERTFRYWVDRLPASPKPASPEEASTPRRRKDRRRGRFDLEVTLPGIQLSGDTTAIEMFGLPLKLVAVQDPGDRDQELWESFDVNETENAKVVAGVVAAAVNDRPGLQFVTDQGKPYVAREARDAYERLGLEHAPQKEGTPTAKATLERSFGIVKPVLAPIVDWTRRLAQAAPGLKHAALATTAAGLLVAAVLDAFRLGRRHAPDPVRSTDRAVLALVAEETREAARDTDGSRRLTLARIHEEYHMEGARETFVNAYRRHALEDIEEAERALRNHACRCEVRRCDRYYAAILRRVSDEAKARRAKARQEEIKKRKEKEESRRYLAQREALRRDPEARLAHGLDLMAMQWLPSEGALFIEGRGIGHVDVREGIAAMIEQLGEATTRDTVEVEWQQWIARRGDLPPPIKDAIREALDRLLRSTMGERPCCSNESIAAILQLRATG